MQDFETEDQQVEALKEWWRENGKSLIFGLIIGVGGIFGWREYNAHTLDQSRIASDLYNVVAAQVAAGRFTDRNKYEQLQNEFSGSPYAVMAAFTLARYHFEQGQVEEAIADLEWARQHALDEETLHLANIRLATVHLAKGDADAAATLLPQDYPQAFTTRYEELRGDVFVARGDKDGARQAYDRALAVEGSAINPLLRLKRKNLGS